MLKELIYTGIGAAAILRERVEEEIKKLEDKGKLNTEDAKSFLESIEQKGKEEDSRVKEKIRAAMKELIDELGLVTKDDLQKFKEELQSKS